MQIAPYLNFPGTCAEAFAQYARVFGGTIRQRSTFGESPMKDQVGVDWQNKIMHVQLAIGDRIIMGSDAPPQYQEQKKGFSVNISVDDPAEADRIFKGLSEKGAVRMPIQETFWAQRFGMLTDQFGIPWMVNCEKPMS